MTHLEINDTFIFNLVMNYYAVKNENLEILCRIFIRMPNSFDNQYHCSNEPNPNLSTESGDMDQLPIQCNATPDLNVEF